MERHALPIALAVDYVLASGRNPAASLERACALPGFEVCRASIKTYARMGVRYTDFASKANVCAPLVITAELATSNCRYLLAHLAILVTAHVRALMIVGAAAFAACSALASANQDSRVLIVLHRCHAKDSALAEGSVRTVSAIVHQAGKARIVQHRWFARTHALGAAYVCMAVACVIRDSARQIVLYHL